MSSQGGQWTRAVRSVGPSQGLRLPDVLETVSSPSIGFMGEYGNHLDKHIYMYIYIYIYATSEY